MGAFDQFEDQAEDRAGKARTAVGNKRNKSAAPESREQMERRLRQEEQERNSPFDDGMGERMDAERDERDRRRA
ncbi:hypothetical protein [Streptomyces sp. NBC_01190]|uniref:hypothetical protein n=1 Tax=Streptomyces sp. NBC_01190 TaxID=2903767 RepID=UPI00386813F1|nr:hypothetical protein OG519_12370 [Streptomyces sp. NBC_01190]